MSHIFIKA